MRLFCFSILLLLFTTNCTAQSKQSAIKELFGLLHLDSTIKATYRNMSNSMEEQLSNNYSALLADSSLKKEYLAVMRKYSDASLENSRLVLEQILPGLYDKYFTEQEIKDLIIFYKTQTGQKYISIQPEIVLAVTNNPVIKERSQEATKNMIQDITNLFTNKHN